MPDESARTQSIRLVATGIISALIVVLVYLIAVRTYVGQRVDGVAFARRSAVTATATRRTDRLLGTISVASLVVFGGAVVLVALARRRVSLAIAAGAAMSGAVLTTDVLKLHLLTRPTLGDLVGVASNTFPSGHATIGMVLSLGIVMVAPARLRTAALVIGALTSTAFGTAVLSSGWHRPSDTIGAYFVALAWFSAMSALVVRREQRINQRSDSAARPQESRGLLIAAVVGVFCLLMFVLWKSVNATGLRTVAYAAPYVLACIGIDVAGLGVLVLYYVVQRPASAG